MSAYENAMLMRAMEVVDEVAKNARPMLPEHGRPRRALVELDMATADLARELSRAQEAKEILDGKNMHSLGWLEAASTSYDAVDRNTDNCMKVTLDFRLTQEGFEALDEVLRRMGLGSLRPVEPRRKR